MGRWKREEPWTGSCGLSLSACQELFLKAPAAGGVSGIFCVVVDRDISGDILLFQRPGKGWEMEGRLRGCARV